MPLLGVKTGAHARNTSGARAVLCLCVFLWRAWLGCRGIASGSLGVICVLLVCVLEYDVVSLVSTLSAWCGVSMCVFSF